MDPDSTLTEIRDLVDSTWSDSDKDGRRFLELVEDLDNWLTGGGFLPSDWVSKKEGI